jgi:hypothetical protein
MAEKKRPNAGCRSRGWRWDRGIGEEPSRANRNGLYLAIIAADGERFSVELKVEGAGVPGADDDILTGVNGALGTGRKQFGGRALAIGSDGNPALFAGSNLESEFAGGG